MKNLILGGGGLTVEQRKTDAMRSALHLHPLTLNQKGRIFPAKTQHLLLHC